MALQFEVREYESSYFRSNCLFDSLLLGAIPFLKMMYVVALSIKEVKDRDGRILVVHERNIAVFFVEVCYWCCNYHYRKVYRPNCCLHMSAWEEFA